MDQGARDLFEDVLSCYFPLVFSARAGDPDTVAREALADGLQAALVASPAFAPMFVPLALEKLTSTLKCAFLCLSARCNLCAPSAALPLIAACFPCLRTCASAMRICRCVARDTCQLDTTARIVTDNRIVASASGRRSWMRCPAWQPRRPLTALRRWRSTGRASAGRCGGRFWRPRRPPWTPDRATRRSPTPRRAASGCASRPTAGESAAFSAHVHARAKFSLEDFLGFDHVLHSMQ